MKLGMLPATILRPSACPLIVVPSMNWLCVHTVATVVISLIVTLAGGGAPTEAISAMAGLSPLDGFAAGLPPFAARYRIVPLGADGALIENRPSAPVPAWPNCCGLPALAANSVTVELAIGAPPPRTWPVMFAAVAVVQNTALTSARIAAAHIRFRFAVYDPAVIDHAHGGSPLDCGHFAWTRSTPSSRTLPRDWSYPGVMG